MDGIIKGKAWVGGDDIFAFDIIPQKRWTFDGLNPDILGKWALEDVDPEFKDKESAMKDQGYSIIVAGKSFGGGGKTIEHPVIALKGAGIKVVLADSFARYNYRISINNALPVVVCPGLNKEVQKGDELIVDLNKGEVVNLRTGVKKHFAPLSEFVWSLLKAGGLVEYTKQSLK